MEVNAKAAMDVLTLAPMQKTPEPQSELLKPQTAQLPRHKLEHLGETTSAVARSGRLIAPRDGVEVIGGGC